MARVCKREGFQTKRGIVRNNCYAYSVGVLKLDGDPYKLQPGDLSTGKSFELDTCDEVVERTKEDLKVLKGRAIKFSEKCGRNENKIALILAPGMDYHFLVFHNDVNFLVTCNDETRDSIAKRFDVDIACVEKKKSYKKDPASWSAVQSVGPINAGPRSHPRSMTRPVPSSRTPGRRHLITAF